MSNWKVYEISLQGKGGETRRETRGEPERDSGKFLVATSLVTAVLAPITAQRAQPSPSEAGTGAESGMIPITVVGPGEASV